MKIEPGTLCVVKHSFPDVELRGRFVVVIGSPATGEILESVCGTFRASVKPGIMDCMIRSAVAGDTLPLIIRLYIGGRPTGKRQMVEMPKVGIKTEYLIPISGPGLDLSEKWEREIEDDVDEAGFKAKHWKRVTDLLGDHTWD
jgi:hypothetical protein